MLPCTAGAPRPPPRRIAASPAPRGIEYAERHDRSPRLRRVQRDKSDRDRATPKSVVGTAPADVTRHLGRWPE
jgi:hypothetical protein